MPSRSRRTALPGAPGAGRSHDLIVLDLMLPGLDDFEVLRTLRAEGITTPVLVLTARGDEADKVSGFTSGADDYVTKPFGLREMLARIGALLRRSAGAPSPLSFGPVVVDPATHRVTRHGLPVTLRPKEYDLLQALLRRNGAVATRSELLREVWGYHESVLSRTLDTHVGELRRKLEDDPTNPRHILTVRKNRLSVVRMRLIVPSLAATIRSGLPIAFFTRERRRVSRC